MFERRLSDLPADNIAVIWTWRYKADFPGYCLTLKPKLVERRSQKHHTSPDPQKKVAKNCHFFSHSASRGSTTTYSLRTFWNHAILSREPLKTGILGITVSFQHHSHSHSLSSAWLKRSTMSKGFAFCFSCATFPQLVEPGRWLITFSCTCSSLADMIITTWISVTNRAH